MQQVKALGYSPGDVRHLLLTHLDRDHAGGVPDFPNAKVHVHRARIRHGGATQARAAPKGRYITEQWKHGPDWAFYGEGGEDWFGFKGVRALGDREADILMIPLPGHTLGHCGIAVRIRRQMAAARRRQPISSTARSTPRRGCRWCSAMFQRRADMDRAMRIENQERLRALKADARRRA